MVKILGQDMGNKHQTETWGLTTDHGLLTTDRFIFFLAPRA